MSSILLCDAAGKKYMTNCTKTSSAQALFGLVDFAEQVAQPEVALRNNIQAHNKLAQL